MRRLGVGVLVIIALSGGIPARRAVAGLPGYFEWILWEETEWIRVGETKREPHRAFRWVLGPYSKLAECETDRDHLAAKAKQPGSGSVIRFLCVPDTVNPRQDPRWQ
jgi:hypothetical protein